MKPASVIIMDEHPIVRMSIEVLLEKNSNIQVVLETDDSRAAIDHLRTYPVDLVILDIELPGSDGFTLLKRIKSLQEKPGCCFYPQSLNHFMPDGLSVPVPMVSSANERISMISITR